MKTSPADGFTEKRSPAAYKPIIELRPELFVNKRVFQKKVRNPHCNFMQVGRLGFWYHLNWPPWAQLAEANNVERIYD